MAKPPGRAAIAHTVTSGQFCLDGGTWDVDNNVWIVGDASECVVIDAPHDGAVCFWVSELGALFSGDTLFEGGPGATGRSYSDFPTIISSLRDSVLTLPDETVVYTGHGANTTIGAEAPSLPEWVARGH
jgi:glyoxylase-like metal-dependent hydrolase (beta-lactamase superfamily II)